VTSGPPGGSTRAAPANSASVASHGAMWIMLMHTIASAASTGHGAVTSSASGGRRLGSAASSRHAAMLARGVGVGVGRLPGQRRHAGGEVHRVLAGAAGDLQHQAAAGQDLVEDLEDRVAVAQRRGGRPLHGPIVAEKVRGRCRSGTPAVRFVGEPARRPR
jgi:hypothetical protein